VTGLVMCGKPQFSGECRRVKLNEICSKGKSSLRQKDVFNDGPYSVYGASGVIGTTSDYQNEIPYVAVVKDGAGVGRASACEPRTSVLGTMQALIPNSNVERDYLLHLVRSLRLGEGFSGSTIPHIYFKDYGKLEVPLPPLETQKEIVSQLGLIEAQIEQAEAQTMRLDQLVKSRFIEMFGDCRLARQNQGWKRIGNIGEVLGGATPKTQVEEYWGGGLPWLTPAEIGDSIYVNATSRTLTSEGVRSCSLSKLPAGTVLLSSRAPIGKVAIAGNDMYCNQGFKNIVCGDSVLPRYLYSLLKFNSDYLNSLGRGATFKEISKRIVEDIKIPVPAVELQLQFECFAQKVDKLRFRCLETLRLYLATVHFVAQQIVVMAGLFWGQRNIKPRCFNATWIRMEDGQHG